MPDEMKIASKGGDMYAIDFGGGVETITADGSEQPGLGGTLLSVKAETPDVWIVTRKQGGRLQLRARWELSHDQGTLTIIITSSASIAPRSMWTTSTAVLEKALASGQLAKRYGDDQIAHAAVDKSVARRPRLHRSTGEAHEASKI